MTIRPNIYSKWRFIAIVILISANGVFAVADVIARRFPMGIAAVLCLTPCLQREVDLRNGLPARKLDKLGWSFMLAGALWIGAVYPLFKW